MGLRLTLIRSTALRGLCCGRLSARLEPPAVAAARGHAVLAVRAGVDAGEAEPDQQPQDRARKVPRQKKEKKPPPPRPTHFLALQVSQHDCVQAAIAAVQAALVGHSPHLRKACVEAASAHLTLGVMALPGSQEQQRAGEVLAALAAPLAQRALLGPVEVQLEGLSHFKNQVLYLDVRPDAGLDCLMALAAASRAHFQQSGLLLEADRDFVPHVTVAKTSKLMQGGGRFGGKRGGRGGRGHRDWHQERRSKQQRREQERRDAEARLADCGSGGGGAGPQLDPAAPEAESAAAGIMAAAGAVDEVTESAVPAAAEPSAEPSGSTQPPPSASNGGGGNSSSGATAAAEAGAASQHDHSGAAPAQQLLDYRHIPAEAWAAHVAVSAGRVVLTEIQLCAMQGRKQGGYYPVLCSLPLASLADAGGIEGASGRPAEGSSGRPGVGSPDAQPGALPPAASDAAEQAPPSHSG